MTPQSLAGRSVLAALLVVGFYSLALAIIGGLLYVPYWQSLHPDGVNLPWFPLFCIGLAGTIAFAILPRFDRFEAPGPELSINQQPLLFERIARIADQTGQPMPDAVYLVPDVNAAVTHRSGLMGFGSRRVVGAEVFGGRLEVPGAGGRGRRPAAGQAPLLSRLVVGCFSAGGLAAGGGVEVRARWPSSPASLAGEESK